MIAATIAVASAMGVGVVTAGNRSSDERALRKTRSAPSQGIESKVNALLSKMTLEEKLNQLTLLNDGQIKDNPNEAKKPVGGVFSLTDPAKINEFQHMAVDQSRLHIPILFAYDTIHGYRTIFPIPLGTASSFDPTIAADDHRIGAMESAAVGIKQIYSPMVDVSHEPRWGRSSEGNGEDPYLGSVMAAARVKAAQGSDYSAPDKVVTSVKHFAAYGQPEGGRDYNTTDMSEARLRNFYLPPFKAAIDAGADTAMCSFNAINGVPGCANPHTETNILKKEWGFDGFIEGDYTAVDELLRHGVAANGCDAARIALNGGTDMEMVSTHYRECGQQLVSSGAVSLARINDAVRRILRVKFRAGLFDHPYVDVAAAQQVAPTDATRAVARPDAARSMVLLKNGNDALPLKDGQSVALIGPLGNEKHDMLGPWWGMGQDDDAVTVLKGLTDAGVNASFTEGCHMEDQELYNPANECPTVDTAGVNAAVAGAQQIVVALGETRTQSGEAQVRSNIELPGKQQELLDTVVAAANGKPVTVVLFNGRPLDLTKVADKADAILEAWFPGIEAGHAIADVLTGKVNPGGKLPVSFPRSVGQVPIYYNHEPTGRPCDPTFRWNSRYRDIISCSPLYQFGFGLSYSKFTVSNLTLSSHTLSKGGSITVEADVNNTSGPAGDDVAQLYIHDPVASISQPVRRLRGFERVAVPSGGTTHVTWHLDRNDVGFYDNSGHFVVEPGTIEVYVGDSSDADMKDTFTVQ